MGTYDRASLDELREGFTGEIVTPEHPAYDTARRVHNGAIDLRPAVIARCAGTADVVDALRFGREAELPIAVRGGGHNVMGYGTIDDGLVLDLGPMRGIHVNPATRTVRAQPGLRWRDYNRATHLFGLVTTGGVISTTGISGLTLGGGIGWNMGARGMAIDHLRAAEVVLADGRVVTADAEHEPDLFWGLRGGGGNLGVVTSFLYDAHPLTTVVGGLLPHPLERAPELGEVYREATASAPDELTIFMGFVHAPDGSGTKLTALVLCHTGEDHAAAENDLKPLRQFGPPLEDGVGVLPYPVMNTLLDDGFPAGAHNAWRSTFLTDLTPEVIEVCQDAFARAPSPMCGIVIEHFHGAVTRVPETATAFPHRRPGYNLLVAGEWLDPAEEAACRTWVQDTIGALKPFAAGRTYVNYGTSEDSAAATYGPNLERLRQVKRAYDPENVFRRNHNVTPA